MTRDDRDLRQTIAPVFLAWVVLVLCRVGARVFSVGTGERTLLSLTLLTATVNAYWLIAGPALAVLRKSARRFARPALYVGMLLGAGIAVCSEPAWYRLALAAFHGVPLPWGEAVLARGNVNLVIVALIFAAGWVSDSYTDARDRQRQRDELDAILVDAELRALALQLQPHFLFNTLQLAAEAAYDDIATAKRIVRELQTLLRRTFEFEERSVVPVSDEVDFLQSYIAIQRRRFGARLNVGLHVDPSARDLMIPPLLLQPLVENSIQHGLGSLAREGRIDIDVVREGEHLRVTVRDDGVGFAAAQPHHGATGGLGLGVTRKRLSAMFPLDHTIDTTNGSDGGAIVSIRVPAHRRATMLPSSSPAAGARAEPAARWWSMRGTVRVSLGLALAVANVTGAAVWLDKSLAGGAPTPVGRVAVWFPFEVLIFALAIVLWRGRSVQRWLHQRDGEAQALRAQIWTTRARVAALRSGREMMVSALARLSFAHNPPEFDRLIMGTSELIRSVLSLADDGQSSVELEAELARRYFAVIGLHAHGTAATTSIDIALEAAHVPMPGGSLVGVLGSLMTALGGRARSLSVQARVSEEWLNVRMRLDTEIPADADMWARIDAELRGVESRVRQACAADCEFATAPTSTGLEVLVRFRSTHDPSAAPLLRAIA